MKDFNLPSVIHRYFLEYLPRHKAAIEHNPQLSG